MSPEWTARLIIFIVIFLLLLSIRRRRESIRQAIRRIAIVEATYLGVVYLLAEAGRTPTESLLGGIVGALIVNQVMPGRSRHIPKGVRRKVIAQWELETGKKYNPRAHEVHHVIPFAKGGSSTEDNLRVIPKKENRAKGAKSPWWDLLGR